MSTESPPKSPAYFKWWVCTLLLFASTINYMDRQALSQTSTRIADYFHLSDFDLGVLESAFNVAFAFGVIVVGWLVDRGNIRVIYPIIVLLWSLAGFATGFATSYVLLLICRFALGLFEAGNIPCGVLTVKRVLTPEERPLGNGMFQSGSAMGAIITPMVVMLCILIVERMGSTDPAIAWRLPFRVVGVVGIIWAAVWLLTVRSHHLRAANTTENSSADTYWRIFANRRFWVALIVVLSINSTWRTFGFWLPRLMKKEKGYSELETNGLSSAFFLAADVGSIVVGIVILRLARGGMRLSLARALCFAGCTGLTATSILTAFFPKGISLVIVLLLLGFGALGVFPIYYAISQEISVKHQGKTTATLSFLNAVYLAGLMALLGLLIDYYGSISHVLAAMGLFPLIGMAALVFLWKDPPRVEVEKRTSGP